MSPSTVLSAGPQTQDLPVELQGRLLREPPEHTHEGDLVREAHLILRAPAAE